VFANRHLINLFDILDVFGFVHSQITKLETSGGHLV